MERIGRYEILSELGRGAMGVVYLARDPKIGRDVAIKTIKLAEKAAEDEVEALRERLMREAQSAGRLSHPGIVTIYDVDEEEGVSYIAMEYVQGETLETKIRNFGRIEDLAFVAKVLREAAAALDYAHGKGIIHRDVKPGNVMLADDGGVKLMDFGIARVGSAKLTQTGTVMGTPSYMSPEQVKGENLDGRSDQFSLAVIAYEMLTGKKPFHGDNLTSVIFKIVSAAPDPTTLAAPWIAPGVDAVVLRALSKDPKERFGTCREFGEAFAAAAGPAAAGEEDTQDVELSGRAADASLTQPIQRTAEGKDGTDGTGSSKLPPLSKGAGRMEEEAEAEEGSPWGGRILVAALLLISVGAGVFIASNPGVLEDPVGTIQAVLGGETETPSPAPEPESEPVQSETPPLIADAGTSPVEEAASISAETAEVEAPPALTEVQPETTVAAQPTAPEETTPLTEETAPPPAPAPKAAAKTAPPKLVSVYFRTEPIGAEINVDNRPDWTCKSPCRLNDLPPGPRQVTAKLDGYYPASRRIDIGANREEIVQIRLEDSRVTALITSEPPGAEIYIDGRKLPEKTNAKIPLARGTYEVKVVKAGVGEAEQVLVVDRDQIPFAKFVLKPKQ